jgi:hypothetical protein
LNAGIVKALADPDLVSRLKTEGEEVVGSNPEVFDALLRRELTQYGTSSRPRGSRLIDHCAKRDYPEARDRVVLNRISETIGYTQTRTAHQAPLTAKNQSLITGTTGK